MNTEAVKYVAAYVGGTLVGVFGASLAVNKIRESIDPTYHNPMFHLPSEFPYLGHDVNEYLRNNK